MEKVRQEPGKKEGIQGGTLQGGIQGQSGEQIDHKRVRAMSEEVPGMEAMLSDPGEPHKGIEKHSMQPEQTQKSKGSSPQKKPGEPPPGWQEHPILGKEAVSPQNEKEERARRKMEAERAAQATSKKKPAA